MNPKLKRLLPPPTYADFGVWLSSGLDHAAAGILD